MIDPKAFQTMKPEQAVRAAVALVFAHGMTRNSGLGQDTIDAAFRHADYFLEKALKP